MKRRELLQAGSGLAIGAAAATGTSAAPAPAPEAGGKKIFRWAFNAGETGFDPAQINDLYSNYVIANIFETPLQYDYLARPPVIKPRTAAAMPEISADFKTITVRIRPGIYFADDPAFKGQKRELVAADYVYQLKRIADPRFKSPYWPSIERGQLIGLADLRKQSQASGKFDYDREIEGIRALDRFTFQMRLGNAAPRFYEHMCDTRPFAGVAREVVEAYPNETMGHPVGTGPFRLVEWRRSSRIVLERNPAFRDEFYDAQPGPTDERGQAVLSRLKGRKMPFVDRVELSIIEESQPRWLSFLNGQQDTVNVPLEFIDQAVPGGKVAPALARKGITLEKIVNPDVVITFFNMDNPMVGGYTPEKVALRRAISLGYDVEEEIRLIRRGSMIVAHSQVPPLTTGYDPAFRSEMGRFDRAAANALLDTYGYVDKNGDGWREQPDGSPLVLEIATESSQLDRAFNEHWKRQLDRLQIRVNFKVNQWPENLRAARSGKLMIWLLGNSATSADPGDFLAFGSSKDIGTSNFARFKLAEYDRLFERQQVLPDGPERQALHLEMKRLFVAYMPYKIHGHRFANDLSQPWLIGYRRHPFARDFFKYIDIDPGARAGA
jgi:ABC-type transport system substrate-binding protein